MNLRQSWSVSALVAGVIASLISYAGPLLILFQVAQAAAMPADLLTSWIWAISIGSGVLGIALSQYYKVPVIIAWSAPGSALLITLLPEVSMAEAVGAYLMTALLLLAIGVSGAFDRLLRYMPASISAAMLAGILLQFGQEVFLQLPENPWLMLLMLLSYLLARRFFASYAVVAVVISGITFCLLDGQFQGSALSWQLAEPVWVMPEFSVNSLLNISLPLLVVALTGQFVPGIAVLRAAGYSTPASPLLCYSALGSLLLAPMLCHGLNLAAITAALCTSEQAHADPARRYVAGISGGLTYLLLGSVAASLVALLSAFPQAFIAGLAGLALFAALSASLHSALANTAERDSALITFLLTASGISLWGLASAFWGVMFGLCAHAVLSRKQPN
jgi:benzoate membrane transport protein